MQDPQTKGMPSTWEPIEDDSSKISTWEPLSFEPEKIPLKSAISELDSLTRDQSFKTDPSKLDRFNYLIGEVQNAPKNELARASTEYQTERPFIADKEKAKQYLALLQDPKYRKLAIASSSGTAADEEARSALRSAVPFGDQPYHPPGDGEAAVIDKENLLKRVIAGEFDDYRPPKPAGNIVGGLVKNLPAAAYYAGFLPGAIAQMAVGVESSKQDDVQRIMLHMDDDPALGTIFQSIPTREPSRLESAAKGLAEILPQLGAFREAGGLIGKLRPIAAIPVATRSGAILPAARRIASNLITAIPRGVATFEAANLLQGQAPSVGTAAQGGSFELTGTMAQSILETLPAGFKYARVPLMFTRALLGGATFAGGASLGAAIEGTPQPDVIEEGMKGFTLSLFHQAMDRTIARLGSKSTLTPEEEKALNDALKGRAIRSDEWEDARRKYAQSAPKAAPAEERPAPPVEEKKQITTTEGPKAEPAPTAAPEAPAPETRVERPPSQVEEAPPTIIEKTPREIEPTIPPSARRDVIDRLGGPQVMTQFGELGKLSDADLTEYAKQQGQYETAPPSEAPGTEGRGPANQAQIDKYVEEGKLPAPSIREKMEQALIAPELKTVDGVVSVEVESFGQKGYVPLLENYNGKQIVKTGDNISVWDPEKKTLFVVALDDSKMSGNRFIDQSANTVENARNYIDWVTSTEKKQEKKPITPQLPTGAGGATPLGVKDPQGSGDELAIGGIFTAGEFHIERDQWGAYNVSRNGKAIASVPSFSQALDTVDEISKRPKSEQPTEPPALVEPAGETIPAGEPPQPVQTPPGTRETGKPRRTGGAGGKRGTRIGGGQADTQEPVQPSAGPSSGVGDSEGTVAISSGRNYRISDTDNVGKGGLVQKYNDNIAAIKLLKLIESEARPATIDEQKILVKYVGWGGLAQKAFDPAWGDEPWRRRNEEIENLLTSEELDAARASTPNAHYTSPDVIKAIYSALSHLGFKGGKVLEPSLGSGNFFGLMPEEMMRHSKLLGIELDSLTGRIASLLYPDADIRVKGFEDVRLPSGFFSLAITNVPFGNYPITDTNPKFKGITNTIHNYFVAKQLDLLHPGGILVNITSHYMLDARTSEVYRKWYDREAEFIGAIRLPNTAFKENAATEVTTDIIFMRKRGAGEPIPANPWLKSVEQKYKGKEYDINEYYVAHPEMLIGRNSVGEKGLYGGEEYSLMSDGRDVPQAVLEASKLLPAGVFSRPSSKAATPEEPLLVAPGDVKPGGYSVKDGKLYRREGDSLKNVIANKEDIAHVQSLLTVRDALRSVLNAETSDSPDVDMFRGMLNAAYNNHVKKHGHFLEAKNKRRRVLFADDPDYPRLIALERINPETKKIEKADIFSKRLVQYEKRIESAESAKDALGVVLNETGRIDWGRMSELTGKPLIELQEELAGLVYETPGGAWVMADEYLSGNVKQKLHEAEAAAALDPKFKPNVEAMKKVLPTDLKASEIEVRLGTSWVPTRDIEDFLLHLMKMKRDYSDESPIPVKFIPQTATWVIDGTSWHFKREVAATKTWGTERYSLGYLLSDALNMKWPSVYDRTSDGKSVINPKETEAAREKLQSIKDEFKAWIYKDQERAQRLVDLYNETMNNYRQRVYDGSHLTFPGMTQEWRDKLRPLQKSGIWRILQGDNTLLAWPVGFGKTMGMVGAGMEMRRLGLRKRPVYVVPNYALGQWHSDMISSYPNANVLLVTKADFAKEKRQAFISRVSTGDWDAVLMTHGSFGKIGMTEETYTEYITEQIDEVVAAIEEARDSEGKKSKTVKELEKTKKRLEAMQKKYLAAEKKENTVYFEELGIDQIFIDEAHNFKNLFFWTKMSRIAGLGGTSSQKASDMFLKSRYVNRMNNGKGGIVFATGTPVSNSLSELFTMQRFLQMAQLKENDLHMFDNWAGTFGDIQQVLELATEGRGYRSRTRFSKLTNLPELLARYWQVADVIDRDKVTVDVPKIKGGKAETILSPGSEQMRALLQTFAERADAIRKGHVDPRDDNMLKISTEGRRAALDLRLLDPSAPDLPDSKTNLAVAKIFKNWEDHKAKRLTQLVFINFASPNTEGFNLYADIKNKLMAKGVPAEEIAFIHDTDLAKDTDTAKAELFAKVRSGEVRILMGSVAKMGEGLNVQKRLKNKLDLDPPWKPSELEQGDGRILRPGNENDEVELTRFATEGSFDGYMWQTLETKARSMGPIMSGSLNSRTAEDVEGRALTYAEVKALASGNPLVMEKVKVDQDLIRFGRLRSAWVDSQFSSKTSIASLPGRIQGEKDQIAAHEDDLKSVKEYSKDAPFSISIGGKEYTTREDAGKALLARAQKMSMTVGQQKEVAGVYRGFNIEVSTYGKRSDGPGHISIELVNAAKTTAYMANLSIDPGGTIRSIEYSVSQDGIEGDIRGLKRMVADNEKRLADLQEEVRVPFKYEKEYTEAIARQRELEGLLAINDSDTQSGQVDNPDEGEEESPDDDKGVLYSAIIPPEIFDAGKRLYHALTKGTTEMPLPGVQFTDSELKNLLNKSFASAGTLFRVMAIPMWVGEKYPGFGDTWRNGKMVSEGVWGIIDRKGNREYLENVYRIEHEALNEWRDAHALSDTQKSAIMKVFETLNVISPVEEDLPDALVKERFSLDDASIKVYRQIRDALDAGLQLRMALDRFKIIRGGNFTPKPGDLKRALTVKKLQAAGFAADEIDAIREVVKQKADQIQHNQIRALWDMPKVREMIADLLVARKYSTRHVANYFPLTRPWDYRFAVIAKNPDLTTFEEMPSMEQMLNQPEEIDMGDIEEEERDELPPYFATFATAKEANEHANELRRRGFEPVAGEDAIRAYHIDREFPERFKAILTEGQLFDIAESQGVDPDNPVLRQMAKELRGRGFDRHFIERMRAPGFQWTWKNVEKNVLEYVTSSARKYAKDTSRRMALDRLTELRKAKLLPSHIVPYAEDYIETAFNTRPNEWGLLRQGIYMTTLGLSVSNLVTNLTQPWTTTYNEIPILLEQAGVMHAPILPEKLMFQGYSRAVAYQLAAVRRGDMTAAVPDRWKPLLAKAKAQGVISPLELEQLSALARDPRVKYPIGGPIRRGVKKFWRGTTDVLALTQRVSEVTNRIQTMMVMLEIGEKYAHLSGNELYEYAVRGIRRTQYAFGAHNLSAVSQNLRGSETAGFFRRVVRLMMILRGYMLNTYSRMADVLRTRNVGANARFFGTLGALAGVRGLPLYGLLIAAYDLYLSLTDDEDTAEMKEHKLYSKVEEELGLPRGFIRTGPLGAFSGIETSKLLGIGDFPPTKLRDIPGVATSLAQRASYLGGTIAQGDVLRSLQQFPFTPRVVSNVARSKTIGREGIITSGRIVYPKKDVTDAQLVKLALGFTPTEMAEAYEGARAQKTVGLEGRQKYQELIDSYVRARVSGDNGKVGEVTREVIQHNISSSLDNLIDLGKFIQDGELRTLEISRSKTQYLRREELKKDYRPEPQRQGEMISQ